MRDDLLLEHGADSGLKEELGYTALEYAKQRGKNPEVVEILQAAMKTG